MQFLERGLACDEPQVFNAVVRQIQAVELRQVQSCRKTRELVVPQENRFHLQAIQVLKVLEVAVGNRQRLQMGKCMRGCRSPARQHGQLLVQQQFHLTGLELVLQ